jgi:hypothetical protein
MSRTRFDLLIEIDVAFCYRFDLHASSPQTGSCLHPSRSSGLDFTGRINADRDIICNPLSYTGATEELMNEEKYHCDNGSKPERRKG